MATSKVALCNAALSELKENQITSLTEDSEPARLCNIFYDITRDEVLTDHPWNFAIKRFALSLLATSPLYGFESAFQLPGECLRILDTDLDETFTARDIATGFFTGDFQSQMWAVEGRTLVANSTTIKARYIQRVDDPQQHSPQFDEAFTYKMASKLAYPLTGDLEIKVTFIQIYSAAIRAARSLDSQENSVDNEPEHSWELARLT
jgi:hypothetical protein